MTDGTSRQECVHPVKHARVSITREDDSTGYPSTPPFNPPRAYPEYRLKTGLDATNRIYDLVRNALVALARDERNLGTGAWNPFGDIIVPGNTVLIKPSLVKHYHSAGKSVDSVIVHGSVIRAVLDYVWIALKGCGKIVIADTPIEHADFAEACNLNGLTRMVDELSEIYGIPVEIIDLRSVRTCVELGGRLSERPLPGDPLGYTLVDLGRDSELAALDGADTNYYTLGDHSVNHFDPHTREKGIPNQYHNGGTHAYRVGNTVLTADTVISVAKLKTHKKAGVTLNLKNAIGIINGKAFIPHHRPGAPPRGDSYPSAPPRRFVAMRNMKRRAAQLLARNERLYTGVRDIARRAKKVLPVARTAYAEWGEWYGNDTIWRTILDINKVLLYADKSGLMREIRQRNYFCLIDGVVGMDGEGPMGGNPFAAGVVLAGNDPVAVDAIATEVMGFDSDKVQTIKAAGGLSKHVLGISDLSRIDFLAMDERQVNTRFHFRPSRGWIGHLERR